MKIIDLKRLKDNYTIDGTTLIKPEKQATFLDIDEFKLHDGYNTYNRLRNWIYSMDYSW